MKDSYYLQAKRDLVLEQEKDKSEDLPVTKPILYTEGRQVNMHSVIQGVHSILTFKCYPSHVYGTARIFVTQSITCFDSGCFIQSVTTNMTII